MMQSVYDLSSGHISLGDGHVQGILSSHTRLSTTRRNSSSQDLDDRASLAASYYGDERPKPIKFIYSHARLPLRVHINKHDTTSSIITSVKTFFGIHEGLGVSFENHEGQNIIPQYENVKSDTDIQVRLTQEIPPLNITEAVYGGGLGSPGKAADSVPWVTMPAPHSSRPASRNMKGREPSPDAGRKRGVVGKSNASQRNGRSFDADALNGFSDSDAGSVSVTSSRRDVLASADISVENIVEGNRRKGAKFESSELPLFKPPQVPLTASISSASPQKRFNPSVPSPLPPGNQRNFSSTHQAFPSPVSYSHSDKVSNFSSSGHSYARESHVRSSTSAAHQPSRLSAGSNSGVLPTPAPTIGSAISDEDVALQLMRLGDPGNIPPPRPPASTADDALSGKAELASSADYSDSESEDGPHLPRQPTKAGPARKKLKMLNTALGSADTYYSSGEEYDDQCDGSFKGESDDIIPRGSVKKSRAKSIHTSKSRSTSGKASGVKGKTNHTPISAVPPSPYSLPQAQSKASPSQLASDEEDLSAKPRCQRCRKSKKGCDRQRPCGRCKDAGIGIEGCVSEDEGNGRKGRFGRHMGVPVKKTSLESVLSASPSHNSPIAFDQAGYGDAGKKRKR